MAVKIRSMHPWSFWSGEWATLLAITRFNDRYCYVVAFLDGITDLWPVADVMGRYEIKRDD